MKATDIRRGHVIMIDGQPCRVMDFTHRTPGNLRAFVQVRLRNLVTGNTFDTRLAATDFVDEAPLETKEFQVLYRDQGGVHVMDTTTYEQHTLDAEAVGDHADWLQPEMHIQVEWLNGRPVGIELPSVVELTVVQTSPVMRSATKTASTKPAKLSNGVTIQVRSEEHTSELQSQSNLVCRLLLEKKKKPTLCIMLPVSTVTGGGRLAVNSLGHHYRWPAYASLICIPVDNGLRKHLGLLPAVPGEW